MNQYIGRRRNGPDEQGAEYGAPVSNTGRVTGQHGPERLTVHQRNASKPRTPGRRRASVPETGRPHLSGRLAKALPLAVAMAVGAAVAAFAAPAANSAANPPAVTCALELPAQPLTAEGLSTPFQLAGVDGQACHEANAGTAAFAQGLILDPATGKLSVYDPLVIDNGTRPAVAPVLPTLPANAVVALWFGFNGNVLTLRGQGAADGNCVNGLDGSPFGQFSYCNAGAFFTAANAAIASGKLTVPPIGTAADGQPCPTTRDFGIVDQDQSDNVTTTYLALAGGRTAQNTQTAAAALKGRAPQILANGSDNLLLDHFVDPALNCVPWTAPDLANNGIMATSLGLNELQAAADQVAPVAIVPVNDPMVLDNNGAVSNAKTDLYRAGVDQLPLAQVPGAGADYCANLRTIGVQRTKLDRTLTDTTASPDAGAASNLFTFLAMRLQQSYVNLGCQQLLQQRNPVHLKTNADGLVVDAIFDAVAGGGTTASPSAGASVVASVSPSVVASPSASVSPVTSPSQAPPVTTSTPATVTSSAAAPPPPASTPAAPATSAAPGGPANTTPSPIISVSVAVSVGVSAAASSPAAAQQPTQPAVATSAASTAAAAAGGGSGGNSAGGTAVKPITAVTTTATPITVVGFEHNYTTAGSNNPNSALSGPDPMANAGFSIMNSRVFWALGGALLVLAVSLLLRRGPRQRKQSRRGVSS